METLFDKNDLDFEITFLERVRSLRPDQIDVLRLLGHDYTRRGLHEQGLEVDEKLASLRPADPEVCYNLACSYALLERKGLALRTLARAIELGYADFEFMKKDTDLAGLHNDPRFRVLVRLARAQRRKPR